MVILRHKKHGAPADGAWHGVTKQAFLHHQNPGGARAAHKLVPGEENRVLRYQSLLILSLSLCWCLCFFCVRCLFLYFDIHVLC